jgi:DNA-binding NtrC family response regulator
MTRSCPDKTFAFIAIVIASPWARDREYLRYAVDQHQQLRAIEAASCRDALSALSASDAQLVLCDESFPWRDLLSYLADAVEPPRVIVVAAAPQASLYAEVLNLGGYDVIAKPFSAKEVELLLARACSPRDPLRSLRRESTREQSPAGAKCA